MRSQDTKKRPVFSDEALAGGAHGLTWHSIYKLTQGAVPIPPWLHTSLKTDGRSAHE